jgi:hypothetical protein
LKSDNRPWLQAAKEYAFVDRLAALQPRIKGQGNRERFQYWLDTFEYMRAMGRLGCVWGEFKQAMEKVKNEKDAGKQAELARSQALPLRVEIVNGLSEVYSPMLKLVSNPGELGTIANWEQHIQTTLIDKPGVELSKYLGGPLPDEARLSPNYQGPDRIVVPCVRSSLRSGESLRLKVILPSRDTPRKAALHWRPLGKGGFKTIALRHVARSVYQVELPAETIAGGDFEYYIQTSFGKRRTMVHPATAPKLNQTVVIQEGW